MISLHIPHEKFSALLLLSFGALVSIHLQTVWSQQPSFALPINTAELEAFLKNKETQARVKASELNVAFPLEMVYKPDSLLIDSVLIQDGHLYFQNSKDTLEHKFLFIRKTISLDSLITKRTLDEILIELSEDGHPEGNVFDEDEYLFLSGLGSPSAFRMRFCFLLERTIYFVQARFSISPSKAEDGVIERRTRRGGQPEWISITGLNLYDPSNTD